MYVLSRQNRRKFANFEDTHSINKSNHSNVIYAQPLEGDLTCVFPANFLNQSEASVNSAKFLSKSHDISANSLPSSTTNEYQPIKSTRPISKQFITSSDLWSNVPEEVQTTDSFGRLQNEVAPIPDELFARKRSMRRAGAIRRKKPTQRKPTQKKERRTQLKFKKAQILANLRSKRGKVASIQRKKKTQVIKINAAQPKKVVADDRNSLPSLSGILDADILSELVDEDPTYRLMKQAILSRDYEGFSKIDPYIKSFGMQLQSSTAASSLTTASPSPMLANGSLIETTQISSGPESHDRRSAVHMMAKNHPRYSQNMQGMQGMYFIC